MRYASATHDFGGTAFGLAMEDTARACKVLADPDTGCLLGAHLMGPYASTMIQPLIQAMTFGQHLRALAAAQERKNKPSTYCRSGIFPRFRVVAATIAQTFVMFEPDPRRGRGLRPVRGHQARWTQPPDHQVTVLSVRAFIAL